MVKDTLNYIPNSGSDQMTAILGIAAIMVFGIVILIIRRKFDLEV